MAKLTKEDVTQAIAKIAGCSKKCAGESLNAVLDTITKALKAGKDVTLPGFGTFSVVKRKARTGRNPATGATLKIPARKAPKFKAGKGLKEAIKK